MGQKPCPTPSFSTSQQLGATRFSHPLQPIPHFPQLSYTSSSMTKERIPMTQRGYDKLQETLQFLKTTRREQISEYMGSAIADGDLRESAAYDEARMQQSENESRIIEIENQLEQAEIVPEDTTGAIGLGAKVVLKPENGPERQFELVGTFEVDVLKGKISDASPIGVALHGKHAGDTVELQGPKGTTKFTVVSVEYD